MHDRCLHDTYDNDRASAMNDNSRTIQIYY